jgi:hypothetical protein
MHHLKSLSIYSVKNKKTAHDFDLICDHVENQNDSRDVRQYVAKLSASSTDGKFVWMKSYS